MNKTISKLSTILLLSSALLVSCGELKTKETNTSSELSSASSFEQTSSSQSETTESTNKTSGQESQSSSSPQSQSSQGSPDQGGGNPPPGPDQGGGNQGWPDQGGGNQPGGQDGGNTQIENDINFEEYGTLPVIKVSTNDVAITSLEEYVDATIDVTNCDEGQEINGATGGIRLRGNSTSTFIKKPYRIKFDSKQSMLGLNNGNRYKSWVLLAEWNDYSYIHNYFTYHFGNALPGIGFSPDSRFVEVYINNKYKGIYLLTEQVQVNKGRVDIDESGVDDGTIEDTGYLLEMESVADRREEEGNEGEAWFRVDGYANINHAERSWTNDVAFYVIKSDAHSNAQVSYIKNYMGQVYDAIYKDQDEESVSALIDVDSALDMYILQLIANDYDNNYSSVYLYKDKGGKLEFGPPWDFDLAYGAFSGQTGSDTQYMYHLLNDLGNLEWFRTKVSERLDTYLAEGGIFNTVLSDAKTEIASHQSDFDDRDYVKWRQSGYSCFGPTFNSEKAALEYFDTWLDKRLTWIDGKF